jgi:hypothetical protein
MNFVAVGLGMLVLLITTIAVFTYSTQYTKMKIFIGIVLLLLFIFFGLTIYKHYDSLSLHSIYLKWSTKMLVDRKLTILYIPIFMLLLVGFIFMIVGEFAGFWSAAHLNFDPHTQIYHELSGVYSSIMSFFLIVQFIWGLSFVK